RLPGGSADGFGDLDLRPVQLRVLPVDRDPAVGRGPAHPSTARRCRTGAAAVARGGGNAGRRSRRASARWPPSGRARRAPGAARRPAVVLGRGVQGWPAERFTALTVSLIARNLHPCVRRGPRGTHPPRTLSSYCANYRVSPDRARNHRNGRIATARQLVHLFAAYTQVKNTQREGLPIACDPRRTRTYGSPASPAPRRRPGAEAVGSP